MPESPEIIAADYWNKYLEHNHLRAPVSGKGPDTDAGAFLAWMLEAAGDILRSTPSIYTKYPDAGYMWEKWHRLERHNWDNDWRLPLSNRERADLDEIETLIKNIPVSTDWLFKVKNLLLAIAWRNKMMVEDALKELKPLIQALRPVENFKEFAQNWR
jgi:hypothetical protein